MNNPRKRYPLDICKIPMMGVKVRIAGFDKAVEPFGRDMGGDPVFGIHQNGGFGQDDAGAVK